MSKADLAFSVVGALVMALLAGTAHAASCPPSSGGPAPSVRLKWSMDAPRYDYTKSMAELEHIKGGVSHGNRAVGLTTMVQTRQVEASSRVLPAPGGGWCAWPSDVTLHYRIEDVVVYIAREVPRNGCRWNKTMAHEKQHVAISRDVLSRDSGRLKQEMTTWVRRMKPAHARTAELAAQQVLDAIGQQFEQVSARTVAEHHRRNGLIDTPENYARESAACGNDDWMTKAQR